MHYYLPAIFLLMLALTVGLLGVAISSEHHAPLQHVESLDDLRWNHRLLLVFAPAPNSVGLQTVQRQWRGAHTDTTERHLTRIDVVGTQVHVEGSHSHGLDATTLRSRFGVAPNAFAMVLVGKDGTEKMRTPAPSPRGLTPVFDRIDSMPMRQQEMRDQANR